ncbi:MAG: hypothetical protein H6673_06900 [Anaerolineales bacterium]|nr:hypothetical protein [Anaerolineales bacterium]
MLRRSIFLLWVAVLFMVPTPARSQYRIVYSVVPAFYEDQQVFYYIFNNGTPVLNEGQRVGQVDQYRLVDSTGQPIEGQYDIIPTDQTFTEDYSDLREIVEVAVPDDYVPNSLTSVEALAEAGLLAEDNLKRTGITHNIPVVRANSQLQGHDHDLIPLWGNGNAVYAFDFGATPAETAPIYKLITGIDDLGDPIFLGGIDSVVEQMHADEGYSDFWQVVFVTVPEDTPQNSIRSYEQIVEAGYPIDATSLVVNCPAIRLEVTTTAYLDGEAVIITQIDRPDLDVLGPPAYQQEERWVLSVEPTDEAYTGFCEVVRVFGGGDGVLYSDASTLVAEATLEPQGTTTTCAVLWELLEDGE